MSDEQLNRETSRTLNELEPSVEFPRDAIRARIRASVAQRQAGAQAPLRYTWIRVAAAVAASLLIFVAGVEYGRGLGAPATPLPVSAADPASTGPDAAASDPILARNVSLSIQTHGSRYVAEMARLAETFEQMSPEQQQQAREVALAVLFGAAAELVRATPEDDAAASVARLLLAQKRLASGDRSLSLQ